MCIAVPVPILDIGDGPMPMGHVNHGGRVIPCCFAYVPEAQVGDYVLVQHGFAIDLLDPDSAAHTLAIFTDLTDQIFAPSTDT